MPKPHPEDRILAELASSATVFSAHLRRGPFDKETIRCSSYGEALEAAERLNATSRYGRRAIVYAITPKGWSISLDERLAAMAGLV